MLDDEDDDLSILKRLRDLPRNTQVDSRVGAISDLLGEAEIFKTLKLLRWPKGTICPRCKSTNVEKRTPPPDAPDKRHYYVCLDCDAQGRESNFDDFTGLEIQSLQGLRQSILCWYLLGVCSIMQIAKVLGLSLSEVIKLAGFSQEIESLPKDVLEKTKGFQLDTFRKKTKEGKRLGAIFEQEEATRSKSKSPLKPGYKSKT